MCRSPLRTGAEIAKGEAVLSLPPNHLPAKLALASVSLGTEPLFFACMLVARPAEELGAQCKPKLFGAVLVSFGGEPVLEFLRAGSREVDQTRTPGVLGLAATEGFVPV